MSRAPPDNVTLGGAVTAVLSALVPVIVAAVALALGAFVMWVIDQADKGQ